MKVLLVLAESSWKTEINFSSCVLFHMKTRVSLKYFVSYCRYILVVGRASHIAVGEVCFRRLKGWRKLWRTLTRTQSEHLNHLKIQTGMTFCFVYVKISLFLQYRTIVFDYEMILFRFSHSGGIGGSPHLTIVFESPSSHQTWCPHGHPPPPPPTQTHTHTHLKMKPPIWKTKHRSMKWFLEAQ